jgi:hypothetical protein
LFDSTLNLKVYRTGGGSNKALGRRVDHLSAQVLDGLLNSVSGHAVTLAEYCDFFAPQLHGSFSQSILKITYHGCRSNITDMPSLS